MFAILPDFEGDDVSSDFSESESDQGGARRPKPCEKKRNTVPEIDADKAGRDEQAPVSQSFPTPGVSADNVTSVVDATAAADAAHNSKTSSCSKDNLKKFLALRQQRVKAAEEKVPEGYRRRRKRKRRRDQDAANRSEAVPKKSPHIHPTSSSTQDQSGEKVKKEREEEEQEEGGPSQQDQDQWNTLKSFLHVNSHISQGVDHGKYNPNKCGLEKRLDEAVAEGDFEAAEALSEELSIRDLGCRIAKAADARDYIKWKTEREEERAAKKRKKKKKLAWGFEVKNRWEMKANM